MSVPFRWLRDPVTLGSGKLETLQVMRAAGAAPSAAQLPFAAELQPFAADPPTFAAEAPPFAAEAPPFAAEAPPFAAEPPPPFAAKPLSFAAEPPPVPGLAMEPLLLLPDFTVA
jgi:hypothetical protein